MMMIAMNSRLPHVYHFILCKKANRFAFNSHKQLKEIFLPPFEDVFDGEGFALANGCLHSEIFHSARQAFWVSWHHKSAGFALLLDGLLCNKSRNHVAYGHLKWNLIRSNNAPEKKEGGRHSAELHISLIFYLGKQAFYKYGNFLWVIRALEQQK